MKTFKARIGIGNDYKGFRYALVVDGFSQFEEPVIITLGDSIPYLEEELEDWKKRGLGQQGVEKILAIEFPEGRTYDQVNFSEVKVLDTLD